MSTATGKDIPVVSTDVEAIAVIKKNSEKVMVFSLAGSLQLPGIPTIPAIEYSMDAMASQIVNWLTEKTQMLASSPLRGDLIIPNR